MTCDILFNSISVNSGQWACDNEHKKFCAMPIYDCKDLCFKPGLTPGPLDLRPGHNPLSYCGSKSCSNQCGSWLFVEIHVF